MGKRQLWSLYYSHMARMVPWKYFGNLSQPTLKNPEITKMVLVNLLNQTDPFLYKSLKSKSNNSTQLQTQNTLPFTLGPKHKHSPKETPRYLIKTVKQSTPIPIFFNLHLLLPPSPLPAPHLSSTTTQPIPTYTHLPIPHSPPQ